ncbi:MAG: hypothetical protein IT209_11275 [Armatimonadetes bacterium]|nr:hypothetical protein [Armatimonadota bacterium]
MTDIKKHPLAERLSNCTRIDALIRRAMREAVSEHRRAGRAVATWENGKVVLVAPQPPSARRPKD